MMDKILESFMTYSMLDQLGFPEVSSSPKHRPLVEGSTLFFPVFNPISHELLWVDEYLGINGFWWKLGSTKHS